MQAETITEPDASRVSPLPSALVLLGAIGTGLLWEPLAGVFGQTVQLNWVGTSAFALWGVVNSLALWVAVRRRRDPGSLPRVIVAAAAALACLAVVTWITIFATGAIGTGASTSSPVDLEPARAD